LKLFTIVGSIFDEDISLILPMALWPRRTTRPLTEINTRHLRVESKGRPARKADSLTAICKRKSRKCGSLDVTQPYGLLHPLTFSFNF
jgi:hypothetical protein